MARLLYLLSLPMWLRREAALRLLKRRLHDLQNVCAWVCAGVETAACQIVGPGPGAVGVRAFPGLLSNMPVSCLESAPAKAGLLLKSETLRQAQSRLWNTRLPAIAKVADGENLHP